MAYSTKIPSLKVKTSIDSFNKLLEVLTIQTENKDENITKKAIKLKEKLLKFSIPREENEETFVDIRFYQNEVMDMFHILFDVIKEEAGYETDYYKILLDNRNRFKENE